MKKILLTLGLVLLCSGSIISSAPGETNNVKINGSTKRITEAAIKINGETVKGESPAFVLIDRTFVPVRLISEYFGYKVDWNGEDKSVKIHNQGRDISLAINSNDVNVDGVKKILHNNAVPRLVTFPNGITSTMVPIRFISENLGYSVGWDGNTTTVTINGDKKQDMSIDGLLDSPAGNEIAKVPNGGGISIATVPDDSKPSESKPNNHKMVRVNDNISVQRSSNNQELIVIETNEGIRFSKDITADSISLYFESSIDLSNIGELSKLSFVDYVDVVYENEKGILNLKFNGATPIAYLTNSQKNLVITYKNSINGINIENIGGKEYVKIDYYGERKINKIEMRDPSRVVLDFIDSNIDLDGGYKDLKIGTGIIKNVRVSQFVPDKNYYTNDHIVRVVLDLENGYGIDSLDFLNDGGLMVTPTKTIKDHIDINNLGEKNKEIFFNYSGNSIVSSEYDVKTKTLTLIMSNMLPEISDGQIRINDSLIRSVGYTGEDGIAKVTFKFKKSIVYDENYGDGNYKVTVYKNDNIKHSDITIALDAGHGGVDPGAIASDGYQEKVVAKNVADRVQELLLDAGYNVYRIRPNDETIDYVLRGPMANDMGSDIFVSIHANSAENSPNANGVEILYAPQETTKIKLDEQKPLAQALLNGVLNRTNANNRGLVKRPNVAVLRMTTMPAALVELGFLSNENELELLKSFEYQEKLAQGIYDGIVYYLENDF